MSTALLFPGHGSQTAGMRESVERLRPGLLELATGVVGEDPFPRVDDGTRFVQPAILCASLAGYAALDPETKARASFMAGHSLREFGGARRRGRAVRA